MLKRNSGLDRIFETLADPTRRAIVERLATGPATVSELAEPTSLTLAGVMAHLKVLEECDIVTSEKSGRIRTCRLSSDPLREAEAWLAGQRTVWEQRLDRLADVLHTDHSDAPDPDSDPARQEGESHD